MFKEIELNSHKSWLTDVQISLPKILWLNFSFSGRKKLLFFMYKDAKTVESLEYIKSFFYYIYNFIWTYFEVYICKIGKKYLVYLLGYKQIFNVTCFLHYDVCMYNMVNHSKNENKMPFHIYILYNLQVYIQWATMCFQIIKFKVKIKLVDFVL